MGRKKSFDKLARAVALVGGGVLKRAEESLLLTTFFFIESLNGFPTSRGAWQAYRQALQDLAAVQEANDLDEETLTSFKRAWQRLRKKGLVSWLKSEVLVKPKITAAGWRRLRQAFPTYDDKRFWDGRIYLITYDIPEDRRSERILLRRLLAKLRVGPLQLSVYLTPYSPKEILKKLLAGTGLAERVLVSDFGEDGNVGEKSLRALMAEVYHLKELNRRYREYLNDLRGQTLSPTEKMRAVVNYYAILGDDPQLPFPLLPKSWAGDKAYRFCRNLLER